MKVLKFGGSSVGNPDSIKQVRQIIGEQALPCIVVISALHGVTDQLNLIAEMARKREDYNEMLGQVVMRHHDYAKELISDPARLQKVLEFINSITEELNDALRSITLSDEVQRKHIDIILSAGERLSSFLIANFIEGSIYLDARSLIRTWSSGSTTLVDFSTTNDLIQATIDLRNEVTVIPGFIASGSAGETTTLGRGGSDYTAAIVAAALKAEALEIWTDVDGFMTADPKKVEKAYTIKNLTYSEAMELSHFGARVIYTPTLRPVYKEDIPVRVRNTFNPASAGTLVNNKSTDDSVSPIKGISSIDHINLITLQGPAMVGVTGTSARLFGALAKHGVNVILITQASSEYSITFAVDPSSSASAAEAITCEFENEILHNAELNILVEKNLSIIAIVGEKMKNTPGISATLFRALGRNGINVVATAQGSSELNISVVIRNDNIRKALNVIHDGFFLSPYKDLNLFIAGTGLVGSSLIRQLHKQYEILFRHHNLKINLIGIINSQRMLIDKKSISLDSYREQLKNAGEKADIKVFIETVKKLNLRGSTFIDCTADEGVAEQYGEILSGYISIVTANKIACSSGFSYYKQLKNIAAARNVRFMYETTVGAGLPVIKTINDLVLSGDRIYRIEAVLSGTLNFIFNELSEELPLSKAIRKAREKGYSEPDPRIDLSGTDVVRKIMILAREAGYCIEKEDVEVTRFLPEECFTGDLNDFYTCVEKYDREFELKRIQLLKENKKWRFFATLDNGKAKVGLAVIGSEHPSYHLEGSNNIVLITTERYKELPMVIKGYGAGADVTAAGVFADIMRVVNV